MIWILHFHRNPDAPGGEAEYIAIYDSKPTDEEREPDTGYELVSEVSFIGDLDSGFPANREFEAR